MRAIEGVCYSYRLQRVLHSVRKASGGERRESLGGGGPHDTSEGSNSMTTSRQTRRTTGSTDNGNISTKEVVALNSFANAIRGARDVDSDIPNSLNSQLYSMLRGNINSRRAFLNGMVNLFDEMQVSSPFNAT